MTARYALPRAAQERRAGPGPSAETPKSLAVLRPGRLDGLSHRIARLLRKAFVTAEEAAYVWRRARAKAGIGGRPSKPKRLPEVLTLEEFQRILADAYCADLRAGSCSACCSRAPSGCPNSRAWTSPTWSSASAPFASARTWASSSKCISVAGRAARS